MPFGRDLLNKFVKQGIVERKYWSHLNSDPTTQPLQSLMKSQLFTSLAKKWPVNDCQF